MPSLTTTITPELLAKAIEIVRAEYPNAFCQKVQIPNTVGTYPRDEFIIQRLIKSKDNIDGDEREDLSATRFTESEAWIDAADRVAKYDSYSFYTNPI